MKLLLIVSAFFILASCSENPQTNNTEKQTPDVVLNNFKSDFPDAVNPEWEYEDGYYEVEWMENGVEKELLYDENGNLIASETEIATSELPSAITEFILENYPDYSLKEAEIQEKSGEVYYFVEIEKGNDELELKFTEDGGLVNSMSENEEGEDD